jgi:hypothetical protein
LILLTLLSWLSLALAADAIKAMTGEGGSSICIWLMLMGRWGATESGDGTEHLAYAVCLLQNKSFSS